ncbi:MAG: SMC-Scp complex subunit ScpB [Candidatus Kaistia colombiensis]|nr:MAG: SMC-Scp complex subunit ScpB [Kaistia sp.]
MADLGNLTSLAPEERRTALRMVEAMLFASAEPLGTGEIAARLPEGSDVEALIRELEHVYSGRGVNLVKVAGKYMFRTASDLAFLLQRDAGDQKKLSRAALETLAIIAYHQPVTRAEIEEVRGVSISKGTLDVLMEAGWIKMRGRRRTPGRPVTYGTTESFLAHFGLEAIGDLPGLEELKGAGLLDGRIPPGFTVPEPRDGDALTSDEDPLDPDDLLAAGLTDHD